MTKESKALAVFLCAGIDGGMNGNNMKKAMAEYVKQPAWHDASTVPGLWLAKSSGIVRLVDDHDIEHLQKHGLPRWYGPIQEDKE